MKFEKNVNVHGINTAVSIREGQGPTLVCIHGHSLSQELFNPLWDDASLSNFSLVTYDLPGHGKSEVPTDPEAVYSQDGYVSHLNGLITELGFDEVILLGISLGGHLAIGAASRLSAEVRGAFLIGAPPLSAFSDFPKAFLTLSDKTSIFAETLTEHQVSVLSSSFTNDKDLKKILEENIKNSFGPARSILLQSFNNKGYQNEYILYKSLQMPIRAVFGSEEKSINLEYIKSERIMQLLGDRLKILDGCSHVPSWKEAEGYMEELRIFMEQFIV